MINRAMIAPRVSTIITFLYCRIFLTKLVELILIWLVIIELIKAAGNTIIADKPASF